MTTSRDRILRFIGDSLPSAVLPDSRPEPPRHPPRVDSPGSAADFAAEVEKLNGQVIRTATWEKAAKKVAELIAGRNCREILSWQLGEIGGAGLAEELAAVRCRIVDEDTQPALLEKIQIGLTGAEAAVASTGTLVLRRGPGRSSLASLLPPVHLAMISAERIFPDLQTYFEQLGDAAASVCKTSNLVFISGPSRTGDIELTLTLGVHGPAELVVVVYG